MSPRIKPLSTDERDEQQKQLLDGMLIAGQEANIFTTLARHPGLMRHWLAFGGKVLGGGKIPPRDRELMVLRTGWNCQAEYEWGQHARMARDVGLSDDEIVRVTRGPSDPAWDSWDRVVLQAADELHTSWCISDETWAALASRYDDKQLIEVPMLVGQYHLVAMTLNTLGVEREEGLEGWPT